MLQASRQERQLGREHNKVPGDQRRVCCSYPGKRPARRLRRGLLRRRGRRHPPLLLLVRSQACSPTCTAPPCTCLHMVPCCHLTKAQLYGTCSHTSDSADVLTPLAFLPPLTYCHPCHLCQPCHLCHLHPITPLDHLTRSPHLTHLSLRSFNMFRGPGGRSSTFYEDDSDEEYDEGDDDYEEDVCTCPRCRASWRARSSTSSSTKPKQSAGSRYTTGSAYTTGAGAGAGTGSMPAGGSSTYTSTRPTYGYSSWGDSSSTEPTPAQRKVGRCLCPAAGALRMRQVHIAHNPSAHPAHPAHPPLLQHISPCWHHTLSSASPLPHSLLPHSLLPHSLLPLPPPPLAAPRPRPPRSSWRSSRLTQAASGCGRSRRTTWPST
jgi:hypothetical protein